MIIAKFEFHSVYFTFDCIVLMCSVLYLIFELIVPICSILSKVWPD